MALINRKIRRLLFADENTDQSQTESSENDSYYFNKQSSISSSSIYPNSTKCSCETNDSSQISFEDPYELLADSIKDISMKKKGIRSRADLEKVYY